MRLKRRTARAATIGALEGHQRALFTAEEVDAVVHARWGGAKTCLASPSDRPPQKVRSSQVAALRRAPGTARPACR